jgi:hypothetical protein
MKIELKPLLLAIAGCGRSVGKPELDRRERIAAAEPSGEWIDMRCVPGAKAHTPFASERTAALVDGERYRLDDRAGIGREGGW